MTFFEKKVSDDTHMMRKYALALELQSEAFS
jgi:hypothetical protein